MKPADGVFIVLDAMELLEDLVKEFPELVKEDGQNVSGADVVEWLTAQLNGTSRCKDLTDYLRGLAK